MRAWRAVAGADQVVAQHEIGGGEQVADGDRAASAEPASAASHGRIVKCRISSPRAMMTVCGSLRLPKTGDRPDALTDMSFHTAGTNGMITHY